MEAQFGGWDMWKHDEEHRVERDSDMGCNNFYSYTDLWWWQQKLSGFCRSETTLIYRHLLNPQRMDLGKMLRGGKLADLRCQVMESEKVNCDLDGRCWDVTTSALILTLVWWQQKLSRFRRSKSTLIYRHLVNLNMHIGERC